MTAARRLALALAAPLAVIAGAAGQRTLAEHLGDAADYYELGLVYSPARVPDTSFAFSAAALDPTATRPAATFDRLTAPFGLRYARLGSQVVITTERGAARFAVSGFVEDARTGERLVGATVALAGGQGGTTTNGYGYFSLPRLREGQRIVVSYLGYPSDTITAARALRSRRVRLQPTYRLQTVEVRARSVLAPRLPIDLSPQSPRVLEPTELVRGDRDVVRWLLDQPGVSAKPGGFGGYSLRGADPEHNLILLDDATLYLPTHAGGYASSVLGRAIRSVQVDRNAGPARYGDRVGGVVDVRLREGSREKRRSTVSIGIADLNADTEGPVGRGSYYVAARRGLTDFWLRLLRPTVQTRESSIPDLDFSFTDLTGKINYPLGDRQRVYASVYVGQDRYTDEDQAFDSDGGSVDVFTDQSSRRWRNAVASLRHNATIGQRWFVNTVATLSEFQYDATDYFVLAEGTASDDERFSVSSSLFTSSIRDIGFKQDASFAWRTGWVLTFGSDLTAHRFRVGTSTNAAARLRELPEGGLPRVPDDGVGIPSLQTFDASVYANAHVEVSERFEADVGLRLSSQLGGGSRAFFAPLPRLAAQYELAERWRVFAKAGLARQFIHSISTQNPGLPRDLWVPSVAGLRPQRSAYASLGLATGGAGPLEASLTGYLQQLGGLARFDEEFQSLSLGDWVDELRFGDGAARGVETQVGYDLGRRVRLDANYTFALATRRFADSGGSRAQRERHEQNRRHSGLVSVRYRSGERWSLGATWRVGSGLAARLPTRNPVAQIPDTNVPLTNSWTYDGPQQTLRAFHALDLGARRVRVVDGIEYRLSFGVQNVYLRKNPLFLNLQRTDGAEAGERNYRFTQLSMLPVLPFARYTITF